MTQNLANYINKEKNEKFTDAELVSDIIISYRMFFLNFFLLHI
jgi:hypothetical protein